MSARRFSPEPHGHSWPSRPHIPQTPGCLLWPPPRSTRHQPQECKRGGGLQYWIPVRRAFVRCSRGRRRKRRAIFVTIEKPATYRVAPQSISRKSSLMAFHGHPTGPYGASLGNYTHDRPRIPHLPSPVTELLEQIVASAQHNRYPHEQQHPDLVHYTHHAHRALTHRYG